MRYTILRILAVVTAIVLAVLPTGVDFDNAELALSQASCEESDGCMPRLEWVCGLIVDMCPFGSELCCPFGSELCTGGSEEEEKT